MPVGPTRRHQYETAPNVIDLGLRLADVTAMQLQSEAVTYNSTVDPRVNLLASGATRKEANFLVREKSLRNEKWTGERIELNAMTSRQFIDWLETKLQTYVKKVIPPDQILAKEYRRAVRQNALQEVIKKAIAELNTTHKKIAVPDNLQELLQKQLSADGSASWDEALWEMVKKTGH